LIVGIAALASSWFFFGVFAGIAGLILGIIGKKQALEAGVTETPAKLGIIFSIIGIGAGVLLGTIICGCYVCGYGCLAFM